MTFKPSIWYPIAAVAAILNVVAAGFAAASTEPLHAGTHAALALAFGLWAQHLRSRRGESTEERQITGEVASDLQAGLDALDGEVSKLRQELSETQERVDFFERMLARGQEKRGAEPQR
jgi:peptidoglycan hydrolase CwlO-like protein